ncbi:hypothetical protein QWT69_15450 [Sporosarcina oncorhynchi]|uniref:Uncharacterized protein n=1 Tax=Sporosarcina oncorhynchi TaxID=3056444 RepID=A0ABZ0L3Q7_9BACL|nr:hypothetical protein [Sporosarcina sp. T2O-4]WOV87232.1 hypothetical protein QWT69_15450 [Sporosarcina sp. T2O-4]
MRVSGNQFITDALMNFVPQAKNDATEKNANIKSEAERHIEDMRRLVAEEAQYQKRMAADQIAKKIARGENVTNEERAQLQGIDEEKLRKAEQANNERKQLNARLANATSKEQVKAILLEGKLSAGAIIEKGDEQYGELLMEAVHQAEADHYGHKQTQPDSSIGIRGTGVLDKHAAIFDVRL